MEQVPQPPTKKQMDSNGRLHVVHDPDWRKLLAWGWEVASEDDEAVHFSHPERPNVTCYYTKRHGGSYVVGTNSPIGFSTPEKAHNQAVRCFKSGALP